MLTIRGCTQIATNRRRLSFRACPASTGVSLAWLEGSRLLEELIRQFNAESRRLWLRDRWRAHLEQVRSRQRRRRR
jgi:hypothetical protein